MAFTTHIDTSRIASFQGGPQTVESTDESTDESTVVQPCAIAQIATGQPAATSTLATRGWVYDGKQCTALSETRTCMTSQCWPWTTERACILAMKRCASDVTQATIKTR